MALASALAETRLLSSRGAFASLAGGGAARVPTTISLEPPSATNLGGEDHTVVATVLDQFGAPLAGVEVAFRVFGVNPQTGTDTTLADGTASFTYTGTTLGADNVVASVGPLAVATKTWEYSYTLEPECVAFYDAQDLSKLTLETGSNVLAWQNSLAGGDPLLPAGAAFLGAGGAINGNHALLGALPGSAGRLVASVVWTEALMVCVLGAAAFPAGTHAVLNADEDASTIALAGVGSVPTSWYTSGTGNTHYLDGVATAAAPMTAAGACNVVIPAPSTGVAVGAQGNVANREWTGVIGDVVLFNAALSAAARARVVAHAKARWGIP